MTLVLALILFPLAAGLGLLCLKPDLPRRILVAGVTLAVCAGSVALAFLPIPVDLTNLPVNLHSLNLGLMLIEIVMSLYIIYVGVRAKHPLIVALALAQAGLMVWFELGPGAHLEVAQNLFVDKFSVIMALINGVVGGGICLYALGYMREYHEKAHSDVPDRRPLFFALLFFFMGAMFGLIFANNLAWLFLFWEITTLCSFLLIGYTQTEEAKRNALRALVMNLAGGLAFALAIVFLHRKTGTIELQALIDSPTRRWCSCRRRCCVLRASPNPPNCRSQAGCSAHGRAHPRVGAPALQHNGQGGRLSGVAHGPGGEGHECGDDGGAGRRGDVCDWLVRRHYHQRRQAGAGLVHGGQSWFDCPVRRHRGLRSRLGGSAC